MKWLIRLTRQDLVLPVYHAVSDAPMPHADRVYRVRTVKQFKNDLDFLLKHYEPVGLEGLKFRHSGAGNQKPAMFLSFDDGLSEVYHLVTPILIARGIPAAFFINTDFVDNRDLFYRYKSSLLLERLERMGHSPGLIELLQSRYHLESARKRSIREFILGISYDNRQVLDEIAEMVDLSFSTFLRVRKPYMSIDQLRELASQGFYIGAHSKNHPIFAQIPPEERLRQYRESMEFVRRELNTPYGIFSFPFKDDGIPLAFFREMQKEGMPGLDASFGTAGLKKDPLPFHHHRIQMESGRASAARIIRGEYLYYMAKSPAGRNKIRRK